MHRMKAPDATVSHLSPCLSFADERQAERERSRVPARREAGEGTSGLQISAVLQERDSFMVLPQRETLETLIEHLTIPSRPFPHDADWVADLSGLWS